jgi:serine-type D-Ala-D-Ala carboxypeptidase/endopeptidase (penicillin-binding protein 4)
LKASILTFLLLSAWLPGQSAIPDFNKAATRIVAEAEKLGVRTGVLVTYVRDKKSLLKHRSKESFIPASNMKLFTAALALEELGKDYVFRTRFYLHGTGDKQVLRIDPGGNPLLLGSLNGDQGYFADLPARLTKEGLSSVSVYLDGRGWSGPARPSSWRKNQWHKSYAAPTGPFVLDLGCITVFIQAAEKAGASCSVWLEPKGLQLPRRGRIETTKSKKKGSVYGASVDSKGLYLSGAYYYKSPTHPFRVAAEDPREVYRSVLTSELRAAGVKVTSWPDDAPVDEGAHLFDLDRPLRPALEIMLRDSNNFMAEQCLRVVAKAKASEGSLAKGNELLQRRFAGLAPREEAWRVGDGSGLSRNNMTSPFQIVALLNRVHASKNRKVFMETLARSGVSGTMKNRLKAELRGAVVAKTGTINGVSALSGYVRCKSGKVALFSILMNYKPKRGLSARVLRKIQDRLVTQIGLKN